MPNWYADLPDIKPKYLAISQLITSLIQEDRLLPSQRLPAERELAKQLKVDRSTVSRAFQELTANGLLVKKGGSGTFVAPVPTVNTLPDKINWGQYLRNTTTSHSLIQRKLTQARALNPHLIDGAANELPMNLIPQLGDLQLNWQDFLLAQRQEQDAGYLPLIQTLERHHTQRRQFRTDCQTLLITGGAQQALLLILSSLLKIGDAVAFTKPSYFATSAVFKTLGVRPFTIPLTPTGLDLAILEKTIRQHRIKLLLLNPTFQNPTGLLLSLEQRQRIIKLCQKYQVAIVEDDVFGWLSTKQGAIPTLKTLAPQNVIYISSLSKLLGSSTRLGWIVAPDAIGQRLLQVQKRLDIIPSMLAQVMANLALTTAAFDPGIAQLTQELAQRRQATVAIFRSLRPEWQFITPQGGFYLWVTQTDPAIFDHLLERQILVKPGTLYGAPKTAFRFNFAGIDLEQQERLKSLLI
ncbi:aminotransferase-like domain-containing protein [Levilactobacillus andaensis]|uniref:aminotransferase-like domain-containing protein n=1 Tax=Levilactobacillus andaensis TaxID=2799570 RepID=UPI001944D6F1|nr:PLP-dependent aminotransferase family protein [Levilactobacillus andaensis]